MDKNIYFLKVGIFLALFLLVSPIFSASLSDGMNEISSYIEDYNSGKINSAQLIVYVEYAKNKMYESLDRESKNSFTEEEIQAAFDKIENNNKNDFKKSEFGKIFTTKDFYIIFSAYPVYNYDNAYYEERGEDFEVYYFIDYELKTDTKSSDNILEETENFISDLKELMKKNKSDEKFQETRDELSKLKSNFWKGNINQEDCEELMKDLGMEDITKDSSSKEKFFYFMIEEKKGEKCWNKQECSPICEQKETCDDCTPQCEEKEVCKEVCTDGEMNPDTNQSPTTCVQECSTQEVCTECPNNCGTYENCYSKCEDKQECKEEKQGEIALEGKCREEGSDINLNAWGEGFDSYQKLNEGKDWNCQTEIDKFVALRKLLQEDVNDDFAIWFFEEFLSKEDYDKVINGENGFKKVMEILMRNEEDIANSLSCSEKKEWPEGFEKIDISYKNNNTNVEVWEKSIPIEWANTRYYTTLYKYSWIPDKELLKELINYKLSDSNTFGPTAKDIARIKADEGQMELIKALSERYGGSLDIRLELVDEEDKIVEKYLQINPDVAIKISNEIIEDPDISIEVKYDTLYNFINYITYTEESNRINGPNWVKIQENEGPGKFFSILGAVSKMWKEGVTIKPRYALLKMFFSAKEIAGLLSQESQSNDNSYNQEAVQVKEGDISKKE